MSSCRVSECFVFVYSRPSLAHDRRGLTAPLSSRRPRLCPKIIANNIHVRSAWRARGQHMTVWNGRRSERTSVERSTVPDAAAAAEPLAVLTDRPTA